MSRKRVKRPPNWSLVDENIVNVERLSLDPEAQKRLGCAVNEHVFLEFPWAFVPRETALRLANESGSALEPFRERLEGYQGDRFLIGYSSTEIFSHDFVVCMTEEARDLVLRRNREIRRKILEDVKARLVKEARPGASFGVASYSDESSVQNSREYLELEISLSPDCVGLERSLSDRNSGEGRDSYVEVVGKHDRFENIFRSLVSRPTQTHLPARDVFVQTYPGYPKNVWTQYSYEDTAPEVGDDRENDLGDEERSNAEESGAESKSQQEPREKTGLELFLDLRAEETIDVIKYNTVVNLHVDDIEKLSGEILPVEPHIEESIYKEEASFISLRFTREKIATDVAWDPKLPDYVAVAYIANSWRPDRTTASKNSLEDLKFEPRVLLWSLRDPLGPQILFEDHRDVHSISFCPDRNGVLLGGASTGQLLVWDINGYTSNNDKPVTRRKGLRNEQTDVPVARAIFVSDRQQSHRLPIRGIRWMPARYKIEETGRLTKLSAAGMAQLVTASEDGTVAIWNLPLTSRLSAENQNTEEPVAIFRPVYRLIVGPESQSPLPILSFSLPSIEALRERGLQAGSELDSKEERYLRCFWIGTRDGLAECAWSGQSFQPNGNVESCSLSSRDGHVHDGPVTQVLRSPHLEDVLLTIGGHVFAIWRDDYLDLPVFRRRSSHRYTACCWTKRPGVLLIGREDGALETWDMKKRSSGPVSVQSISSRKIAGLYLMDWHGKSGRIGLADGKGAYRVLKEKLDWEEEEKIERLDWFEEFVWREVRRKKVFLSWQADFLANDPGSVARRTAREEEERKRELEEAREKLQREHQERLRAEAERKARLAPKSKDAVWKSKEYERMKRALLEKRKFNLTKLQEKRRPAILAKQEREEKLAKAERELTKARSYFENEVATEFPEVFSRWRKATPRTSLDSEKTDDYVDAYFKVRDKARMTLRARQESIDPPNEICGVFF